MIIGAHAIIYSTKPDADRAFLRDVLRLRNVDAGDGWLIFALPPAEVAVHPSDTNDVHRLYLMCSDAGKLVDRMRQTGIACTPLLKRDWGLLTEVTMPGGGTLGIYEPRHKRAKPGSTPRKHKRMPHALKARRS